MESWQSTSRRGTEGAVFVEFLIAFLPVFTMFLCLLQLALLFAVRLVVEHAAVNAARAAAVVIGDDPKAYSGQVEAMNEILPNQGARYNIIRRAAMLSLSPFIVNGTIRSVELLFPRSDNPGGPNQPRPYKWQPMKGATVDKVRVRVSVDAICKIGFANRIACDGWRIDGTWKTGIHIRRPGKTLQAEAVFPYQGASYTYP